nr:DUF6456 domain-containing protein [Aquabacter cavernae]
MVEGAHGLVELDLAESPLGWLATRKGRDGRALISAPQLLAGERLRLDFTRAGLTPRVTTNWSPAGQGTGGPESFTDAVIAARSRVQAALAAVGPELSGALLDVCCFLKGIELVEQERGWPPRAGKVVLGLALDRLAAHYGLSSEARGRERARTQSWRAQV